MVKRKRPAEDTDNESDSDDDRDDDETNRDDGLMDGVTLSKLPSYPHPSAAVLDELDFRELPENFFGIAYGARRTGKTHAISCLLEPIKDKFDFAYLFSATAGLHEGEKGELDFEMIRSEAKFKGFDEDALARIIERQKAVKEHNNKCKLKRDMKPNRTLVIFDDFVHEKAVRYSKLFTELPVLGRHYGMSVICLSQGYSAVGTSGLNKATRDNCDFVMTFLPRNTNDVEKMALWYVSSPKVEGMWFVKSVCEEKHQCLGMLLSEPHLTDLEDYCLKYIAPEDVPKYELGKVQWKLFHEEQKRNRKATLANNVENDRSFFLSRDEVEKRMKFGQATGRQTNRARPSLFDACSGMV
jgi:hypothetical protein